MALKTYVLLDHTKPSASIYRQINATQRVKLDKRIVDHPYLQIAFQDHKGVRRTIRLRLSHTSEIFMDEQKKLGLDANIKHTQRDKDAVRFYFGSLITGDQTVQKFLETSPQFEDFWKPDEKGNKPLCEEVSGPMYKLLDESKDIVGRSKEFKLRVKAGALIGDMKLKQAQDMLIRVYGSFYTPPTVNEQMTAEVAEAECQNQLVDFIDELNFDQLEEFMERAKEENLSDKVTVIIGNAINAGLISFDKVPNQVTKTKGDKDLRLFLVSNEHSDEQRLVMFAEFLLTDAGKPLMEDLQNDLKTLKKK